MVIVLEPGPPVGQDARSWACCGFSCAPLGSSLCHRCMGAGWGGNATQDQINADFPVLRTF